MSTTTATTTAPCQYCGETVEAEYDGEAGAYYLPFSGAHFSCLCTDAAGEWVVRTTQNAVSPARVNEVRYGTQKRAREVAAQIRRDNRREWACGAQLDIVVVRQPA